MCDENKTILAQNGFRNGAYKSEYVYHSLILCAHTHTQLIQAQCSSIWVNGLQARTQTFMHTTEWKVLVKSCKSVAKKTHERMSFRVKVVCQAAKRLTQQKNVVEKGNKWEHLQRYGEKDENLKPIPLLYALRHGKQ